MSLRERFNADLVTDVARRRVVVFVGAGVSKWAKPNGGGRFSDWIEFLNETSELLLDGNLKNKVFELIKDKEYLFASQLLKNKLGHAWEEKIQASFGQNAPASELHKAIARLHPRVLVTTNFDKLIEAAWTSENAQDASFPTIITKIDSTVFRLFRDDNDYIIKLHGDVDDQGSMIFDKSSYQSSAFGNNYYKDLLSSLLLTHTFLFIGFSMSDPAISTIVDMYAHGFSSMRPHYILQSGMPDEIDELWKHHRRLSIIRYSPDDNHAELAALVNTLCDVAQERRREWIAARLLDR